MAGGPVDGYGRGGAAGHGGLAMMGLGVMAVVAEMKIGVDAMNAMAMMTGFGFRGDRAGEKGDDEAGEGRAGYAARDAEGTLEHTPIPHMN